MNRNTPCPRCKSRRTMVLDTSSEPEGVRPDGKCLDCRKYFMVTKACSFVIPNPKARPKKTINVSVDTMIDLLEAAAATSGYVSERTQKRLRKEVNYFAPRYEWQNEVDG